MTQSIVRQLALDFSMHQRDNRSEVYLCANPDLGDFCVPERPVKAVDSPFSGAISAGKNTYVYDAHTYHTKVPPQGIELLIDYYTRPGDVVLDPFCGSGMTGVAATQRGRKAVLCDLSPAAAFIAYNLNTPIDSGRYINAVNSIIAQSQHLEERLYMTQCRDCGRPVVSLYTVWSYGMLCSSCGREFILWDVARDERETVRESKILSEFHCPNCHQLIRKRELKRTRRYPVSIGYKCCRSGVQETTSPLNKYDEELIAQTAADLPTDLWYPRAAFPPGVNTRQAIAAGIDSVDKAYTPRALWAVAHLWNLAQSWPDQAVREKLLFTITSLYQRVTVFSEFRFWGGSGNTANYNVPAIMNEQNVFRAFARKANTIRWFFDSASDLNRHVRVSTQSACRLDQLADKSIDYVFTDPPFGGNINYSEMNFLWESWLGIYTDTTEEAIINQVHKKGLAEYRSLLGRSFSEIRRVLKDGGWLTVVFHNSSGEVWSALQTAIHNAGFSIDGTQTFDKRHGTFKQFVSQNAVGYDLVLNCRKAHGTGNVSVVSQNRVLEDAEKFIRQSVDGDKQTDYVVKYIHVNRMEEFDYRKLYSEWLAHSIHDSLVSLGFDDFRALTNKIIHVIS